MRYYSLTLSNPKSGASIVPSGEGFTTGTGPTFTSLYRDARTGQMLSDPGALQINFDFPVVPLATPQGGSLIKISGVGLKMIGQAANLAGMRFQLKAGMAPGLPLANPAQAGVIAEGNVFQGYGNWEGTEQTLDLIVNPGPPGTTDSIFNRHVSFFWPAGSSLHDAIDAALQAALPEFKREIFIDPRLVLSNDEAGYYGSPTQWAGYLLGITQPLGAKLLGFSYPGVQVMVTGDTIYVFDGAQQPSILRQLNFEDLIGQPTWLSGTQITFTTVMRADISILNRIRFPKGIVAPYAIMSPAAGAQPSSPNFPLPAKNRSIFQGDFLIQDVHHFGNFRDPDPTAWATVFVATPPPAGN